jgi:hypothetical protein
VFATPVEVTKHTEKKWADDLRKDFGLELVLMSREEFVRSLQEPANADVCRSQLGIHIDEKPGLTPVIARARDSAAEVVGDTHSLANSQRWDHLSCGDVDLERNCKIAPRLLCVIRAPGTTRTSAKQIPIPRNSESRSFRRERDGRAVLR